MSEFCETMILLIWLIAIFLQATFANATDSRNEIIFKVDWSIYELQTKLNWKKLCLVFSSLLQKTEDSLYQA
jgi:hypothetical protein